MTPSEIKKVRVCELEKFFQEFLLHTYSVIPISPERINSYVTNPRGKPEDVCLYYFEQDNEIIAFRTIWADLIKNCGTIVRFGWCSGNWVSPNYRRRKLSTLLLDEAFKDWNGQLMFTNYAPESLKGYIKTGLFPFEVKRTGKRFYFNVNLNELYEKRINSKPKKLALILANFLYQILYAIKRFTYRIDVSKLNVEVQSQDVLRKESSVFGDYGRGKDEFEWIFTHPWLKKGKEFDKSYPFSWIENDFTYKFAVLKTGEALTDWMLISNRNGAVKILYWQVDVAHRKTFVMWLLHYCFKNRIRTLTVVDKQWGMDFSQFKNPFVFEKEYEMNIYSSFKIEGTCIFDGDGDYIFT